MSEQALMDYGRFLDELGHQARFLVAAARTASVHAPVHLCPGWTVEEVVCHVGGMYRSALLWLVEGRCPRRWQREPARGQTGEDYLRDGLAELTTLFARSTSNVPAASWWDTDRTYGFWCRRMAHETTIHRIDVEDAAGRQRSQIPPDLALDGVDEALSLWLGHRLSMLGMSGIREGTVLIRLQEGAWSVGVGPGQMVVRRVCPTETSHADAVVSGSAMSVYLWLWGRERPGMVTVAGDEDAAGQLWALMRLATR